MKINLNVTMGNYNIALAGDIAESDFRKYITAGVKNVAYHDISGKLDLPLANHFGQSEIDDKGNPKPKKGFKKKDCLWDADAAAKMVPVYEAGLPGFTATITKYVPQDSAATVNKAKAELAVKLALEQITIEEFKTEMAKLA